MPSHIYIRTGNYKQGLLDNDAAVTGYKNYLKSYQATAFAQGLYEAHNVHMKINCAQMGGDYKDARESSAIVQSQVPLQYLGLKDADGNYYQYIFMQPTLTAVRFGKWDDILKIKMLDTLPYAAVIQHFARGLAYCGKGNVALAKVELAKLEDKMQDKALKTNMDNFSSSYEASCVARLILKGRLLVEQKQFTKGTDILRQAVTAEDHLIYNEPRDWPLPARQYLGDALLKSGKVQEAIQVFNNDLFVNPNNGWSLTGLQLAYQITHNSLAMQKVKQKLPSAWKIKDIDILRPVF